MMTLIIIIIINIKNLAKSVYVTAYYGIKAQAAQELMGYIPCA